MKDSLAAITVLVILFTPTAPQNGTCDNMESSDQQGCVNVLHISLGVILPVVVLLALLVCICCLVRRRRRRKKHIFKHSNTKFPNMGGDEAYNLELSPIHEESIVVSRQISQSNSFTGDIVSPPNEEADGSDHHHESPPPQVAFAEEHIETSISENHKKKPLPQVPPLANTRDKALSFDCKKKSFLPQVPPLAKARGKALSFDSKKKNSLPRAVTADHGNTESNSSPHNEEADGTDHHSQSLQPSQVVLAEEHCETPIPDNHKTKPLPRVPAEPRDKTFSLSRQKKNSLPQVPSVDHTLIISGPDPQTEEADGTDLHKMTSLPTESLADPCKKGLTSYCHKKSSSLRVHFHGESKEKAPTHSQTTTEDNNMKNSLHRETIDEGKIRILDKKRLLHRVPIREPQEKAPTPENSKTSSPCQAPIVESLENAPAYINLMENTTRLMEKTMGAEREASSSLDSHKNSITPQAEPASDMEVTKKSLLIQVTLPEPKEKPPTFNDPKETTTGAELGSSKKSLLRRVPLPEPKEKAPTYSDPQEPTTGAEAGDDRKKRLLRRTLLPEPEEEAPAYSNLKELKAGSDEDKKALVDSVVYDNPLPVTGGAMSKPVVYDDPLPVTGGAMSKPVVRKDTPPVYDDPLPVTKPINRGTTLHVARLFSRSNEVKVHPEPEPYEVPIMKS